MTNGGRDKKMGAYYAGGELRIPVPVTVYRQALSRMARDTTEVQAKEMLGIFMRQVVMQLGKRPRGYPQG